jgi:hypothetical protein
MYYVVHTASGSIAVRTPFRTRAEAKREADSLSVADVMVDYEVRHVDRIDDESLRALEDDEGDEDGR